MAKRIKKNTKSARSLLKLEALEQRQLLAGGFTDAQGYSPDAYQNIVHSNGNVYDQVLMKGSSITVNADAGQVTRISFLDLEGDIVQAEFSGAGTLTISLDQFGAAAEAVGYIQPGVEYVKGLATFTIQGSDASTNFSVFSVGKDNAVNQSLFDDTHTGGNNTAEVARLNIVADPANPNGSLFGGIRAGNAVFTGESGVVGITAANVAVQDVVRIGDINATAAANPALVFGTNSQFVAVSVQGGDLANNKLINNTGSYHYELTAAAGTNSAGVEIPAGNFNDANFSDFDPTAPVTKTFTLTASIDNLTGTAGDDTFVAAHTAAAGGAVVSTLDTINGGAGNDLLSISDAAGSAPVSGLKVSNVETLELTSVEGIGGDSLDVSGWTGLTKATLSLQDVDENQSFTAGAGTDVIITSTQNDTDTWSIKGGKTVTLTNNVGTNAGGVVGITGVAGTTTVSVTQTKGTGGTFGALTVNDVNAAENSKASTISSVTVNGGSTVAIGSSALTSLSLTKVTGTVTITDELDSHAESANRTTLALAVNDSTTGIDDAKGTIKQIDITATGKDSSVDVTVTGNVLTTVTVAGDKNVTLTGTDGNAMTTLTATGTGGVTATVDDEVTVTTSSGDDTITLSAATKKAISLGAGNDKVDATLSGDGTLGSGGSIDAGEGTDTLVLTAASAVKASTGTALQDSISGFEKLEIKTAPANNAVIDMDNLDDINKIVLSADRGANNFTLDSVSAGAVLEVTATQGVGVLTVDMPVSAIGNETLGVRIAADDTSISAGKIETGQINAIELTTDNTDTSSPVAKQMTVEFTSANVRTINITGDAGATITTSTGVTKIDGSGITLGALNVTTGALGAAATITGSGAADTINAYAATKAVTITTNAGGDTVDVGNSSGNTIDTGNDGDTITVGTGNNTINAGAGGDTINIGQDDTDAWVTVGTNTVDAGSGADTINIGKSVGQTTIALGSGDVDTVAFKALPTQGGYFVTLTGVGDGDKIDFSAIDVGAAAFNATKVELGQGVSFSDYLNASAEADVGANSVVRWFQYGGDTYIVLDNTADAVNPGFNQATDMVIKLQGTLDLSAGGWNPSSALGVITL